MSDTRFRFTKGALNKIAPASSGSRNTYHDEGQQGLCLRVTETGAKSFFVQRRINGRVTRTTIGRFPEMTVGIARKEALKVLTDISQGINPIEKKRERAARKAAEKAQDKTLGDVFKEYVRLSGVRETTASVYQDALFPVCRDWLDKPLLSITPLMIRERHMSYGSKSQANHAMRVLSAVLNHHIDLNDLDKANPVQKALRGKGKASRWHKLKRRKTYVEKDQMKTWFDAVEALPEGGTRSTWVGGVAKDLFLFQMYTGLRSRDECASLTWDQVDLKKGLVTYTQTKTTDEADDEVVIPLNSAALELLKSRPQVSEYVFPNGDSYIKDVRNYVRRVRKVLEWTPYDSRRTFMTNGEGAKVPMLTLKRLVNHATGEADVTAGYIGTDIEAMREASEAIVERILRQAGRADDNVIDIHPQRSA